MVVLVCKQLLNCLSVDINYIASLQCVDFEVCAYSAGTKRCATAFWLACMLANGAVVESVVSKSAATRPCGLHVLSSQQ